MQIMTGHPLNIKTWLPVAVASLGLTSLVTQLVMLREFLAVFTANELVIGLLLANWMLLTGLGAWLGRFTGITGSLRSMACLLILLGLLPSCTLFLTDYLRNVVFTPGTMPGLLQILGWSFVVLAPYCLLGGYLFSHFSLLSPATLNNRVAAVYSIESWGSVAGGLLFSFVLVFLLDHFRITGLLLILNLSLALWMSVSNRWKVHAISAGLLLLAAGTVILTGIPANMSASRLYPQQEILLRKETPWGNITVTRLEEQLMFYYNNQVVHFSEEIAEAEERVHYAMLQPGSPRSVLVVSGNLPGLVPEIRKYPVSRIDYVEINPWLIKAWRKFYPALDTGITFIRNDARRYIRKTGERYDVVLLNIPDPVTLSLNRYFTVEFFREIRKVLNKNGIVATSLKAGGNYLSDEAALIHGSLWKTLSAVFDHTVIVPGLRDYFIASGNPVDNRIATLATEKPIETLYVNHYYLDDNRIRQRTDVLMRSMEGKGLVNTDTKPVASYFQLKHWLSQFRWYEGLVPLLYIILALLIMTRMRVVHLGLFTAGFASSSAEIALLMGLQVITGYLYLATGVMVALFMAGLAAGAASGRILFPSSAAAWFARLQYVLAALIMTFPLFLHPGKLLIRYEIAVMAAMGMYIVGIAFTTGLLFSLAARLLTSHPSRAAGELYGADLLGAAIGSLLAAAYLIPLFGINRATLITAAACLAGGSITMLRRKSLTDQ